MRSTSGDQLVLDENSREELYRKGLFLIPGIRETFCAMKLVYRDLHNARGVMVTGGLYKCGDVNGLR